ncbi:hypothetical protein HY837_04090 [archaeon]|nr:hypothetical protein [archaeon]
MDEKLLNTLLKLQVDDKIKINGKTYVIKGKEFHKAKHDYAFDTIIFELSNNRFLEIKKDSKFLKVGGENPVFFECIEQKGWLGFKSTTQKNEKIEKIDLVRTEKDELLEKREYVKNILRKM